MFRKSTNGHQLDMFSSATTVLAERSASKLEDPKAWHNLFRAEVTNMINESIFEVLYSKKMGAPNASIRILIAMMILKEGHGISDEALFESCRFNLVFRSALGLHNLGDPVPTESTYYLFRRQIKEHEDATGDQLVEKMFADLTSKQCLKFNVSGKSIRMDSKLIGSNIRWMSRFNLIHTTLKNYYQQLLKRGVDLGDLKETLEQSLEKDANKIEYSSTTGEVKDRIQALGLIIQQVLSQFSGDTSEGYKTLERVYQEQYNHEDKDDDKPVQPKDSGEIKGNSIQSPYDIDADYRNKNGEKIKGYSVNVTETNSDDNGVNLITSVQTETAGKPDNKYFQDAVEVSEKLTNTKVKEVNVDGAYHSESNENYCKSGIKMHLHALQGKKGRFEFPLSANGVMQIWDTVKKVFVDFKEIISKSGEVKYRINIDGKLRYLTQRQVEVFRLREKIKDTPIETLQKRNNVEATIFQLGFHYRANKTRYRGLIKHKMWALSRCMWINFVRLENHCVQA